LFVSSASLNTQKDRVGSGERQEMKGKAFSFEFALVQGMSGSTLNASLKEQQHSRKGRKNKIKKREENKQTHSVRLGVVYTMDHEVVPRPSKRCDWTLKLSRDDLGLHQGKNGRVTTEVEVLKI
jgi:hypothetical protein